MLVFDENSNAPISQCNNESQRLAGGNTCIKGDSECTSSSNDMVLSTSKSTGAKAENVKGSCWLRELFPERFPQLTAASPRPTRGYHPRSEAPSTPTAYPFLSRDWLAPRGRLTFPLPPQDRRTRGIYPSKTRNNTTPGIGAGSKARTDSK